MYGLTMFTTGHGPERFERVTDIARRAEEAGFDAVWTGELYNRSATIPMAVMALATSRVRIGSNIAYGVGRTPLIWAAEARDLDELSGGRLVLGLGNGTPSMMENWHGVSGEAPAARMEELVSVLRSLWRLHEGPVHHDGRFYRVHLQPTSSTVPPLQPHLPIWIAGINPQMIAVAGRAADGLIGHPMFTSTYVTELVQPTMAAAAQQAGRRPADVTLMGILMCSVADDEQLARDRLAFAISQYAASRVYDRLFALHGWTAAQQQIREAVRSGEGRAAVTSVPDAVIDAVGVACTPGKLAQRVEARAAHYDHLTLVVPAWGLSPEDAEAGTLSLLEEMRPVAGRTRAERRED